MAHGLQGVELINEADATPVVQEQLKARDRFALLRLVATAAGFGLEGGQPVQRFALQEACSPSPSQISRGWPWSAGVGSAG